MPIPGNEKRLTIAVDRALVRSVEAHRLRLVGNVGARVVAVDRYPSVANGEECYVRVFDLDAEVELWHRLVRSAVRGIACAEPEVTWAADFGRFTINLTSEPPVTVALGEDGGVNIIGG